MTPAEQELRRILQEQKAEATANPVPVVEWGPTVSKLMHQLNVWLYPLKRDGLLEVSLDNFSGGHALGGPALRVVGPRNQIVRLISSASETPGTLGKVDLTSKSGETRLICLTDGSWVWAGLRGGIGSSPLTEDSFCEALVLLLG